MNIAPSVKYKDTATMLNELIQKRDALLESYHTDVSNLKQLNIASKNIGFNFFHVKKLKPIRIRIDIRPFSNGHVTRGLSL